MPVRPASAARLVSLMLAVTTPVVWASMEFACRTVAPPVTVTATLVAVSIVLALIAVTISAAVPVRVVTAVALIRPVVRLSRLSSTLAAIVVSLSVIASLPSPLIWPLVLAA